MCDSTHCRAKWNAAALVCGCAALAAVLVGLAVAYANLRRRSDPQAPPPPPSQQPDRPRVCAPGCGRDEFCVNGACACPRADGSAAPPSAAPCFLPAEDSRAEDAYVRAGGSPDDAAAAARTLLAWDYALGRWSLRARERAREQAGWDERADPLPVYTSTGPARFCVSSLASPEEAVVARCDGAVCVAGACQHSDAPTPGASSNPWRLVGFVLAGLVAALLLCGVLVIRRARRCAATVSPEPLLDARIVRAYCGRIRKKSSILHTHLLRECKDPDTCLVQHDARKAFSEQLEQCRPNYSPQYGDVVVSFDKDKGEFSAHALVGDDDVNQHEAAELEKVFNRAAQLLGCIPPQIPPIQTVRNHLPNCQFVSEGWLTWRPPTGARAHANVVVGYVHRFANEARDTPVDGTLMPFNSERVAIEVWALSRRQCTWGRYLRQGEILALHEHGSTTGCVLWQRVDRNSSAEEQALRGLDAARRMDLRTVAVDTAKLDRAHLDPTWLVAYIKALSGLHSSRGLRGIVIYA